MATINKRILAENFPVWQVKVRRKGYPAQSKTFMNRADAETWAATVESEMGRGTFRSRAEAERMTLMEALDRYEREVSPTKRSGASEHYKLDTLRRSGLASYSLANLRGADVACWRDARIKCAAPTTVIRELSLLSHVFTIARKEWGMDGLLNPVQSVRKPSLIGTGRTRRLQSGEEAELLRRAREYGGPLSRVIVFALETAMRRGEIADLRWDNIDLKQRVVHLPMTKNGESRDVPLSSRAVDTLLAMPRRIDGWVFGMQATSITQAFSRVCGTAAETKQSVGRKGQETLQDLRFHDLRHEATSRLFERGLNTVQVAAITGHKTLQMLKRYTHLRAEDLVELLG